MKPVFAAAGLFLGVWALSFWWALAEDAKIDSGSGLFGISGGGYIGHFVRGKGEWCALQRPTGVLQVYYFRGIQNVNLLYDGDLAAHLDLKAGVWHHTAAVFRAASIVELYTDGRKVAEIQTEGRSWRAGDNLRQIGFGPFGSGGSVDEILVLDRAASGEAIARYYSVLSRLRSLAH